MEIVKRCKEDGRIYMVGDIIEKTCKEIAEIRNIDEIIVLYEVTGLTFDRIKEADGFTERDFDKSDLESCIARYIMYPNDNSPSVAKLKNIILDTDSPQPFNSSNEESKFSDLIAPKSVPPYPKLVNDKNYCDISDHYLGQHRQDLSVEIAYYDGFIYYFEKDDCTRRLLKSREDGSDTSIVTEIVLDTLEKTPKIHVNCNGIFLLFLNKSLLYSYTLEGTQLSIYHLSSGYNIDENKDVKLSSYYFYGEKFYFVETYYAWRGEEDLLKSTAKVLDVLTGKISVLARSDIVEGTTIDKILGTNDYVLLSMGFEGIDSDGGNSSSKGWYKLVFKKGNKWVSLNSRVNPPHYAKKYPDKYNPNSEEYIEIADDDFVEIVCFDIAEQIMWTSRKDGGKTYLEPRRIGKAYSESVLATYPTWEMPSDSGEIYFDGKCMFGAESYYLFASFNSRGEKLAWKLDNNGHGECERFVVWNGFIYMDPDVGVWGGKRKVKQYVAQYEQTDPLHEVFEY
jgi:hypothetical protein